jgi:hypothetical protein
MSSRVSLQTADESLQQAFGINLTMLTAVMPDTLVPADHPIRAIRVIVEGYDTADFIADCRP